MKTPFSRGCVCVAVIAMLLLSLTANVKAALTLTIDIVNMTATWSGSAVLDIKTLDGDDAKIYIATTQLDIPPLDGFIENDPASLMGSGTTDIVNGGVTAAPNYERIYVDEITMLIGIRVVDILDMDGGGNRDTQVNVVGNGVTYGISFGGLTPEEFNFLSISNGASLRFFRSDSPENDLGDAGTVVIIPEPSTTVLVLPLAGLLILIRRRNGR